MNEEQYAQFCRLMERAKVYSHKMIDLAGDLMANYSRIYRPYGELIRDSIYYLDVNTIDAEESLSKIADTIEKLSKVQEAFFALRDEVTLETK